VLAGGIVFGIGLALSDMAKPEVILRFLHLEDLGLLLVMGGAVLVTMLAYQLGPRLMRKPLFAPSFGRHQAWLRPRTLGGAALFGVGWGLSGICPGSAIASVGIGNLPMLVGIAGLFAGAWVQALVFADRPGTSGSPSSADGRAR
jgi:uncharacterized membrane protein YedE/YeeE